MRMGDERKRVNAAKWTTLIGVPLLAVVWCVVFFRYQGLNMGAKAVQDDMHSNPEISFELEDGSKGHVQRNKIVSVGGTFYINGNPFCTLYLVGLRHFVVKGSSFDVTALVQKRG